MSTFAELKTEAEGIMRRTLAAATALHATLLARVVNDGMQAIEALHDWQALGATLALTTTAASPLVAVSWRYKDGGRLYLVSDDGTRTRLATSSNGVPLTMDFMRKTFRNPTETADAPLCWTFQGRNLYLGPTPNAELSLELDCNAYVEKLSAAGDTNWFTERVDSAILFEAVALGLEMNEEPQAATYWHTLAAQRASKEIEVDARELASRLEYLRPSPYPGRRAVTERGWEG